MKPLNYAILKYFTKVDSASAEDVMKALMTEYSRFRAFNHKSIVSALMTAEANGLIVEKDADFDANGNVRIFYHANEDSRATINKYITD